MNELVLAIEGGGTKTRVLLAKRDGTVIAREVGGAASPLYVARKRYARGLRALLRRMKRAADRVKGQVIAAGLAGPICRDMVQEAVRAEFGPVEWVFAGESDVAFALFGLDWGVSLVAGTGASCRAHTRQGGTVARGGFGPQFGDEGSGYWIGREAVAAAMRGLEGRGPATSLGDAVCTAYGVTNVHHVLKFIDRSGHVPGPRVAALTPYVFAAARAGDAVAKGICLRAGTELGKLVAATAEATEWLEGPIPLVLTGGVFHGENLIVTPLKRVLRQRSLVFDARPPAPEPAEGLIRFVQRQLECSVGREQREPAKCEGKERNVP